MAANKTVIVLAPNGRRQNVKVTPNTTILQVLEEVCTKHGLKPEEYDIKHHNHILDTTAIMRFSGLPNNAQLEMAAAQKTRRETNVVLGLQLENGDRLMGDFLPTDSLWDVIKKLCPDEADPNSNPVIIYMRREVSGMEALEETTLRSLGLTSGRAMVRFVHRTPEELHHQANVSVPLVQRIEEKFPVDVPSSSDAPPEHPHKSIVHPADPGLNSVAGTAESSGSGTVPTSTRTSLPVMPSTDGNGHAFKTSSQCSKKSNSKPAGHNVSSHSSVSRRLSEKAKKTPSEKSEEMDIDSVGSSGIGSDETNFSPSEVSERSLAPLPEKREPNEEIILLGERNAIAFSLEMARAVPYEDLPDDFFELTLEDARALYRDLKRRRAEMEEAPLTTNTYKSFEDSKRVLSQLHHYRRAVLRIQFPDRTVLQGTFLPLETISIVMEFVRGHLENPEMDFYLYTTPPKNILSPGARLVDAGCVPSAIVHFGTNNEATSDLKTYLREEIHKQFTSPSAATLAACRSRGIEPGVRAISSPALTEVNRSGTVSHIEGNVINSTNEDQSMNTNNEPSTSRQFPQRQQGGPSSKVPKWFKPTK